MLSYKNANNTQHSLPLVAGTPTALRSSPVCLALTTLESAVVDPIDLFNVAALEVLNKCVSVFPLPAKFKSSEIATAISGYYPELEKPEEIFAQLCALEDICENTVSWLIEERFISDRGSSRSGFSITLTQKGLNALNKVPASLDGRSNFRNVFKKGMSALSVNVASGLMVEFFKNGS